MTSSVKAWLAAATRSGLARRLALGAFWSISGTVVARGIALLSSIATARYLGKSGFGEFGAVVSTMGAFLAAASLGLGVTAMKYVAEFRTREPERATRIVAMTLCASVAMGLLSAGALAISAPWISARVLGSPALEGPLQVSAVGLLLSAVNGAQSGALAGFGAYRAIAASNVVAAVVGVPFIVAGAAWYGVIGAVWGTTASLAAGCVLAHVALSRSAREIAPGSRPTPSWSDWSLVWRFSLPAFASTGIVPLVSWVTNAMLVNEPGGFGEMGIWNAANQWFTALLFLPTALAQVVMPALSERMGEGDRGRATKLLLASTALNGALAILPAAVGAVLSVRVMLLYGSGFTGGAATLSWALIAAVIFAFQAPCAQLVEAAGLMWLRLAGNVAWAAIVLASTLVLLNRGAQGLAVARVIGYAGSGIFLAFVAGRILGRRVRGDEGR